MRILDSIDFAARFEFPEVQGFVLRAADYPVVAHAAEHADCVIMLRILG